MKIEGSNVPVTLRSGDVAAVLLYVARRFHYEIGALEKGGVTGHTTHRKVAAPYESNYLSGTAIAIRPDMYPVAAKGGLFPREEAIIRDILAQCDGVVRWGGDDKKLVKESHFQIDVRPGDPRLHALAAKLTRWSSEPGRGAGSGDDPFAPRRVAAARALQQRQKASA
ncbi:hypothetical protein ACIHFE_19110 [Streptomyces sp. NPDC052396]|uniref:hypothetical protein n=1 Tax=Streptomyces sp. NPDC052396 TaxID=3365689 RepID=UPI0037D6DDA0